MKLHAIVFPVAEELRSWYRLKTVRHADQILVVDDGHIVQKGKHEELIKEEGIYKRFVSERKEAASWGIIH